MGPLGDSFVNFFYFLAEDANLTTYLFVTLLLEYETVISEFDLVVRTSTTI